MRALVLASSYPRHAEDVAGRFVFEQCEALGKLGWEIEVLAWRGPGIDASWAVSYTHLTLPTIYSV